MPSRKTEAAKSYAVSDEEFRERVAAFNRENPRSKGPDDHAQKTNGKADAGEQKSSDTKTLPAGVELEDFSAFMPMHSYIYHPTRELWPAVSVNARIEPVLVVDEKGQPVVDDKGRQQVISASAWLDKNSAVEQMTWAPGEPMLIKGRLVSNGGWASSIRCPQPRMPRVPYGDLIW